jgi:hypothetical protein
MDPAVPSEDPDIDAYEWEVRVRVEDTARVRDLMELALAEGGLVVAAGRRRGCFATADRETACSLADRILLETGPHSEVAVDPLSPHHRWLAKERAYGSYATAAGGDGVGSL